MVCCSTNTDILMLYSTKGRKEILYLTTHSTHFIYGYMASDICQRTTEMAREETRCRLMGYSFRLAARIAYTTAERLQYKRYSVFVLLSLGL